MRLFVLFAMLSVVAGKATKSTRHRHVKKSLLHVHHSHSSRRQGLGTRNVGQISNCRNLESYDFKCQTIPPQWCLQDLWKRRCNKVCGECTPQETDVRLVDGRNERSGRVEVRPMTGTTDQRWGVICDMDWDLTNADVICKELKFGPAIRAPTSSRFGECQGSCPSWLSRVKCYGSEQKVEMCDHDDWGSWNCPNVGMTASVECSESGRFQTRLLHGGRVPWEGRLVVKNLFGQLGYVCKDTSFEIEEADVACRSLGYPGGALEVNAQIYAFLRSYLPVVMKDIDCTGEETSLWECGGAPSNADSFDESVNCRTRQYVSVRCDVMSAIEDKWELCEESFCECSKDEKTVTCPNVIHEYAVSHLDAFIPKDAETLKFKRGSLESRGNFEINEGFYKMLTQHILLKSIELDAKDSVECYFNYDARTMLSIFNRKPDNIVDAFKEKTYTPPELKMLPAGGGRHCYLKPSDEDLCTDRLNCYRACGNSSYVDALEVTVRALEFNTQKFHAFYQDLADLEAFQVDTVKNIEIFAQTVYLNTAFNMPKENIKIIARHFEMGPTAEIKNDDVTLTQCTQGIYLGEQRYYLAITGAGNAKVEVWAETVKLEWQLRNCKLIQHNIPDQVVSDEFSLSSTMLCAKYLYRDYKGTVNGDVPDAARKLIQGMVRYVKMETLTRISKADSENSFYAYIYTDAGEYLEELAQADSSERVRFVPWLSAQVLSEVSDKWSELLDNTDKQYKGEIEQSVAVVKAKEATSRSATELATAQTQVEVSQKTIELLNEQYEQIKNDLESKRVAFEKGIQKEIDQQASERAFGIFKAVVGFIGGVLSAKTDPISGVIDSLTSLADLAEELLQVYKMVQDIQTWVADSKTIMDAIVDPSKYDPADYQDKVKFIDNVASLTVSVGAWEKMRVVANAKLRPAQGIDGATDYEIALHEVAIYGKLLTLETVRNAKQLRKVLELKSHLQSHQTIEDTLDNTLNWENRDQVVEWTRKQAFKQKAVVADVVKTYCEAYFYSRFQECLASHYVLPADSLSAVSTKIARITISRLESSAHFCRPPSAYQNKVLEIANEERISQFKTTKAVEVSLREMRSVFDAGLERIRLKRIEVWLHDVSSPGEHDEISIRIAQSGVFYDFFTSNQYVFTSEKPASITFKYKPRSKEITRQPEVDEEFKQTYMNPTPLSTWTISVPAGKEDNDRMNFDSLTKIEIKLFGSNINCDRKMKY